MLKISFIEMDFHLEELNDLVDFTILLFSFSEVRRLNLITGEILV